MPRKKPPESVAPPAEESAKRNRDRLNDFAKIADELPGSRAAETLRGVEAVPTIFPILDYRLGCGGWPTSRIGLIHGASNEGKSKLTLGLMRSFLELQHFAGFIDAERSTPADWARTMMGEAYASPLFRTIPCTSFEVTRAEVRRWCDRIGEFRQKGRIPPETTGILVVDSIRKLVPERLWDELTKSAGEGKKKKDSGLDGMSGRAAQYKAALNSQWMDELVPLLADTRTCAVIIAREELIEGKGMFDPDVIKVGGGRALVYESSVRARVVREWVYETSGDEKVLVGEKHVVELHKSKVGARLEKTPEAAFYTSNGVAFQEGFDRASDVLELGLELGVVEQSGSWYALGDQKLGQGEGKAAARLRADPELLLEAERACRAKFGLRKEVA